MSTAVCVVPSDYNTDGASVPTNAGAQDHPQGCIILQYKIASHAQHLRAPLVLVYTTHGVCKLTVSGQAKLLRPHQNVDGGRLKEAAAKYCNGLKYSIIASTLSATKNGVTLFGRQLLVQVHKSRNLNHLSYRR